MHEVIKTYLIPHIFIQFSDEIIGGDNEFESFNKMQQ